MQRVYIDLGSDPKAPRAGLTGLAAPAVSGILGAPLNAGVAFFRNNEQEALADASTGKFTLKAAQARTGEAIFLDVSMEADGEGAARVYKFGGVLTSDELIESLGEEDSIVCKACVSWTEPEEEEEKCLDFDFTVFNSASRPADSAPANTDAFYERLKDSIIAGAGVSITADDDARTLELASDGITEETDPVASAALATHIADAENPHGTTKAQVGLGNVTDDAQLKAADLDTDSTMAANSDAKVPSQKAVKTHVAAQVAALVDAAPGALDTLNELAAALGDDASFASTVTTALAGKEPAQTAASQAEAEAGTGTTVRSWTPQRIAQAIAALASGGGSPISTPRVLHVESDGDDDTGDGTLAAPFLTAQAAFDVAIAGSGDFVIQCGVGNFGQVLCASTGWPERIGIRGAGASQSFLIGINGEGVPGTDAVVTDAGANEGTPATEGGAGAALTIVSDGTINLGTIIATGGAGGNCATDSDDYTIAPAAGGQAGEVRLTGVVADVVISFGGAGGGGTISGSGANGATGGASAKMVLTCCRIKWTVSHGVGYGGDGGGATPGADGDGTDQCTVEHSDVQSFGDSRQAPVLNYVTTTNANGAGGANFVERATP